MNDLFSQFADSFSKKEEEPKPALQPSKEFDEPDYTHMPQGQKEAQEANGVRDHGLMSNRQITDEWTAFRKANPASRIGLREYKELNSVTTQYLSGVKPEDIKAEPSLMEEMTEKVEAYKESKQRVIDREVQGFDVEATDEEESEITPVEATKIKVKTPRKPKEPEVVVERRVTPVQRAYIGIDNGISGSVGIIYEDGTYEFFKTPTNKAQDYTKAKQEVTRIKPKELADLFKYVGPGSQVLMERPMVNPKMFKNSMSAMRCYEATITILETLNLPYSVIDSKEWQKLLLPIGCAGEELKKASLDVGNRKFPDTKLIKHPDCDGMMIAEYCRIKYR